MPCGLLHPHLCRRPPSAAFPAAPEQFKAGLRGDAIILQNSGPEAAFTLEIASPRAPNARHTLKMKTGQVYTLRFSGQGVDRTLRIEQADGSIQNIPLATRRGLPIPVYVAGGLLAALLPTAWLVFRHR